VGARVDITLDGEHTALRLLPYGDRDHGRVNPTFEFGLTPVSDTMSSAVCPMAGRWTAVSSTTATSTSASAHYPRTATDELFRSDAGRKMVNNLAALLVHAVS